MLEKIAWGLSKIAFDAAQDGRFAVPMRRAFRGLGTLSFRLALLLEGRALAAICEGPAENWRLGRMATIEKNILRIAIHELVEGTLPAPVIINEAVWLTRRFAGPKAPPFINGVLDRVARDLGRL